MARSKRNTPTNLRQHDVGASMHAVRSSPGKRNKWKGAENLQQRQERMSGPVKTFFVDPETLR
jgi:hypothetical protein